MDKLKEYLKRYEQLEATMRDIPPAPRHGGILLGLYLIATPAIFAADAPPWAFIVMTVVFAISFAIIYYDARKIGGCRRARNRPREP